MGRSREGSIKFIDGIPYARVRWTDDIGRRREKTKKATNKTHARQLIKQMLREIDDFGIDSLTFERMTFDQLVDFYKQHHLIPAEYVDGRKVSGLRSLYTQKYIIVVLSEYFGARRLRSITYGDLARFRTVRINTSTVHGKPRSITTVNRELEVLRNMFNIAVREGWVLRNPFNSGPPLIQKAYERIRERILTQEEEEHLLTACTGKRAHLKPLIICALDTGMRRGEIITLTWEDLEFNSRLIHVKAFNTKTQKERWLAMTPRLEAELMSLYQQSSKKPEARIFGITNNFKKAFDYARKLAGLSEVRFHDLRHTAATRLVQKDIPLPLVGRILGHTQANTTMRYVNANIETARRAAEALAAFAEEVVR
jgi:integrase